MSIQPHIRCKEGDIAPTVLIPGDPARVRKIAEYWDEAHEVIFNREFLTMTGTYEGTPISATSTGIGGPSAAIAVEELANIGAKTLIRVGTCGALRKGINAGDLIIPFAAIRAEGTTKEYIPPEFPSVADIEMFQYLTKSAQELQHTFFTGVNRTHDAFYEHINNMLRWGEIYQDKRMKKWPIPLVSSEMECSVVFLVGMLRGLKVGTVLAVNTPEPLDEIIENPDLIYQLDETTYAHNGVDKAIEVALKAALMAVKK